MLSFVKRIESYIRNTRQHGLWAFSLQIERYRRENLTNNPKYTDKHLQRYEFQTYSQNGEDGILSEIFKRIGTTNRYFVEFGVEAGVENNTQNLLRTGWSGLWIEGSRRFFEIILRTHQDVLSEKRLTVVNRMIDASNIGEILASAQVPAEFDLLSIDIDGNDWHVWRAIERHSPRVVVIEYNSHFAAADDAVMAYDPAFNSDGSNYFGASLAAMEKLGRQKGYNLVGCEFTGTNAFFVRTDLVDDRFAAPFTAEHHYEPCRFFLHRRVGHRPRHGPFTTAEAELSRKP